MLDLLYNIISELLGIIVVTAVLPLIWFLVNLRRRKRERNLAREISDKLKFFEIDSEEKIHDIENRIDELRQKIIASFKKTEISFDGFSRLNKKINSLLSLFRISYIKWLLKDSPILKKTIDIIIADGDVSKNDVLFLIREVNNNTGISDEQRNYYITHLSQTLIKQNKMHDIEDLLAIDPLLKERENWKIMRPYVLFGIPIIALGFIISLFLFNKPKPDFTFGAIGFVNKNRFNEISNNIEKYLSQKTGKIFKLEYYGYDRYDELIADIENNTVQGLMANPGTYLSISGNESDRNIVFGNLEIFATHTTAGKKDIRSVIITRVDSLKLFCERNGYLYEDLLPDTLGVRTEKENENYRKKVKEYLCMPGHKFGLVKRYSFSGFLFPRIYLRSPSVFNIRMETRAGMPSEIEIDVSGDHDLSVERVLDGVYHAAATYDGKVTCLSPEEREKLIVLYYSPKAPYNSYWFRKDTPENLKNNIRSAFVDMSKDTTELARNIRNNSANIDGWFLCNTAEYAKRFSSIVDQMKIPSERPLIILKEIESDKYQTQTENLAKSILEDLSINHIADTTSEFKNSEEKFDSYLSKYYLTISCYVSYHDSTMIKVVLSNENNSKTEIKINKDQLALKCPNDDELIKKLEISILDFILNKIQIEAKIYCDRNGPFINYGFENGIIINTSGEIDTSECKLILKEGGIVPISVLKSPKRFFTPFKYSQTIIEKWQNKVVKVNYNATALVNSKLNND